MSQLLPGGAWSCTHTIDTHNSGTDIGEED